MVLIAGFKFALLFRLLMLDCPWAALSRPARGDAATLSYNFTLTLNRDYWYEVNGHYNANTFYKLNSLNEKAVRCSLYGLKMNDTGVCQKQTETLTNVMEEIKKKAFHSQLMQTGGSFSLQGRMTCQREASGHTREYWEFGFDEQILLRFEDNSFIVEHPNGTYMKEKLEDDKDFTMLLTTILRECRMWQEEITSLYEELPTTAPPTMVPATTTCKSAATKLISWKLPVCLSCLITIGILYS